MRLTLLSEIDPDARERLQSEHEVRVAYRTPPEEVPSVVSDAEVVVVRSGVQLGKDVLEAAPDLRLVIRAGSGLDNIDVETAQARGVRVVRIPGPSSRAVAELTIGLMLAVARNIVEADASMRRGEWRKSELGGNLLGGKVAGVVGLGNIGSVVAELCRAMGMTVVGCLPDPAEITVRRFAAAGIELMPLERLVEESDFVTLHVPLDETTRAMFDERLLDRMKPGSYLINTSRGGIVDEKALRRALELGEGVAGAALDVHEFEGGGRSTLADHPEVVLTPHIGSMAVEAQSEIGRRLVEIVEGFANGRIEKLLTEHERVA